MAGSNVALLTGAKRIGADIAVALAERGMDIALVYRASADEANAVVTRVKSLGRRALAVQGDVSDPASATAIVGTVERELGRLDVLINMASLYSSVAFDELTPEDWT